MTTLCRRYGLQHKLRLSWELQRLEKNTVFYMWRGSFPNPWVLKATFFCSCRLCRTAVNATNERRHDGSELYTHTVLQPPQEDGLPLSLLSSPYRLSLPSPSIPFFCLPFIFPFFFHLSLYFPFLLW
uniref:Uncharacterized protein n=1 Tax=Rousettus aegyptiacus TaxID=9407 RepID=A0A7J8DIM6_ROUAE|nr:hypothetical protein HJG63_008674 [Rousettus aegyptiacus]